MDLLIHESVKADPQLMPKSLDEWCEALLYVARNTWANASGGDPEAWPFHPSVSSETGSNARQWET